jgi:hypothetical protein
LPRRIDVARRCNVKAKHASLPEIRCKKTKGWRTSMKKTARAAFAATIAIAMVAWPAFAPAQDYPNRPVRIVVGFPAGTSADITARVVGARMSQILGQQFVVENKPGAGSKLAAEQVAPSNLWSGAPSSLRRNWRLPHRHAIKPLAKNWTPLSTPTGGHRDEP